MFISTREKDKLDRGAFLYITVSTLSTILVFVVGGELLLRILNIGEYRSPVIKKQIESIGFYIPNKSFYQQFFNIPLYEFVNWDDLDFYVPEEKSANAIRIFVFGESAMYGLESSARQLEVMLKRSFPWVKWEVYNFSCPGVNSHMLCELAKSAVKLSPDIFIVYMGNNEAIGPYGENSFLAKIPLLRKGWIIRSHIYLKQLRLVQIFENLPSTKWRGYMPQDIAKYIPGQTQKEVTLRLYEENLRRILLTGVESGVDVIVGTLSYNRFYNWDIKSGLPKFELTPMNIIIKRVVADIKKRGGNIYLADIDWSLALRSPNGVPDYNFFCDNIHFTFEGNYLLAKEWFSLVVRALHNRGLTGFSKKPCSINIKECARYLGWGDANELELLRLQKTVIKDPVSITFLEEREKSLSASVGEDVLEKIISNYSIAYFLNHNDEKIAKQYIDYLLKVGKKIEAKSVALKFYQSMPYSRLAMRLLGNVFANLGDITNAEKMYRKCLQYYPDDGLAKESLQLILKQK